jgi:hypothetical protein
LGGWDEEAMYKNRATVVTRAAGACLQKEQAVGVKARLIAAVEATAGAKVMPAVPVKGWANDLNIIVRWRKKRCSSI